MTHASPWEDSTSLTFNVSREADISFHTRLRWLKQGWAIMKLDAVSRFRTVHCLPPLGIIYGVCQEIDRELWWFEDEITPIVLAI